MPKKRGKVFSTEEYREPDRVVRSAGSIDEKGWLMIISDKPELREGKWGEFWSLPVELAGEGEEGTLCVINSSSKRLLRLLSDYFPHLVGKKVLIQGFGQGFDRYYEISIVEG